MNTLVHKKANHQEDSIEIDFMALFYQLLEYKWLMVTIIALSIAGGKYYESKQIPVYSAEALLQVESKQSNTGLSLKGGLGGAGGFSNTNPSAVQIALIKSRYILTPVIQNLHLNTSISPSKPPSRWSQLFLRSTPEAEITWFALPNADYRPYYLMYEKGNKVALFTSNHELIVTGSIGQRLANQDKSIQLQVDRISAHAGTKFTLTQYPMTDRMIKRIVRHIKVEDPDKLGLIYLAYQDTNAHLATKIVNEIARVTQFKNAQKKSLDSVQVLNFLHEQLPRTQQALTQAELALNQYRADSGQLAKGAGTKLFFKQIMTAEEELIKLHITKQEMVYQYTKSHPSVIELKRRVDILHKEKQYLLEQAKKLPFAEQVMLNLMRDVKIRNTMYVAIFSRIQELEFIKAGLSSDVNILSYARTPDAAVPLNRAKIYGGCVIIGLIISITLVFGRKFLFPRIEDPYWIETNLNIPNLAIIPYAQEKIGRSKHLRGHSQQSIPLLAQQNPRNLSIESLRSLRTSLQVNLSCASNHVISILGVSPGVGKTFVSTNLAYLLATADKRVLLVDADLRKGTVHKYFNSDPAPGFAELIQGSIHIEEALKSTTHKNLTILPRGHYPEDPSELLASESCKALINQFSTQFDIVLIDTAPVLLVTDAVLVSKNAATNYLVLGSNVHTSSDIEIVIKRLSSAGVTVHGSIFNFHNAASKRSSYHYKYDASHYYEDESDHTTTKRRSLV